MKGQRSACTQQNTPSARVYTNSRVGGLVCIFWICLPSTQRPPDAWTLHIANGVGMLRGASSGPLEAFKVRVRVKQGMDHALGSCHIKDGTLEVEQEEEAGEHGSNSDHRPSHRLIRHHAHKGDGNKDAQGITCRPNPHNPHAQHCRDAIFQSPKSQSVACSILYLRLVQDRAATLVRKPKTVPIAQ